MDWRHGASSDLDLEGMSKQFKEYKGGGQAEVF